MNGSNEKSRSTWHGVVIILTRRMTIAMDDVKLILGFLAIIVASIALPLAAYAAVVAAR